jgi:rhomboid protease GluP
MKGHFSKLMSAHSNEKLQEIISKRDIYDTEAYVAAIEELQKRNLASRELIHTKDEIIEEQIAQEDKKEAEAEEIKIKARQGFKETLKLFIPSSDYFYTPILIYLNVAIFIIMALSGVNPIEPSVDSLIAWGGNLKSLTLDGQTWRLFTSTFLHGGVVHLLLNMYALLDIGGILEKKFGNHKFILVYIVTGIFASVTSVAWNENIVSVGASGAIFGMYGLFLALLILKKYTISESEESGKKLLSGIMLFVGYNLIFGMMHEGIDNAAHVGGLVSGIAIGFAYYPAFRTPKYSVIVSSVLLIVCATIFFVIPYVISNPLGEFQNVITEFQKNENKALWMYREEITESSEMNQYYYDRLQSEGIDVWDENLKLLHSLSDMPPYLQDRVEILIEYNNLRKEYCKTLQSFIKDDRISDMSRLNELNKLIESKINELTQLK